LRGCDSGTPDPGELNLRFKWEIIELARARRGGSELDPRDLEDARVLSEDNLRRVLCALPDEQLLRLVKRAGMTLTLEEEQNFLTYARHELKMTQLHWSRVLIEKDNWSLYEVAPISRLPC
jgi:hypothetical protein